MISNVIQGGKTFLRTPFCTRRPNIHPHRLSCFVGRKIIWVTLLDFYNIITGFKNFLPKKKKQDLKL